LNTLELTVLVNVSELDIPSLESVLNRVLISGNAPGIVSYILTEDTHIRKLNRTYRNIDETTDVLSFELTDPIHPDSAYLGEVYISVDRALQQAKDANRTLQEELAHLAIHGTLHLLGFEHNTDKGYNQMQNEEKKYLALLNQQKTL
jgi:probable rRNA maturation factor